MAQQHRQQALALGRAARGLHVIGDHRDRIAILVWAGEVIGRAVRRAARQADADVAELAIARRFIQPARVGIHLREHCQRRFGGGRDHAPVKPFGAAVARYIDARAVVGNIVDRGLEPDLDMLGKFDRQRHYPAVEVVDRRREHVADCPEQQRNRGIGIVRNPGSADQWLSGVMAQFVVERARAIFGDRLDVDVGEFRVVRIAQAGAVAEGILNQLDCAEFRRPR